MEKIKDFFHDFSDVFFAIAVVSIMFVVLSFNLGSWFDPSSNTVLADEIVDMVEESVSDPAPEIEDQEAPATEELNEEDILPEKETDSQENISTKPVEEEKKPDNTEVTTEMKTIVIPNGTPGSGVAKILKENGLIQNTQEFIQTAENLNLAIRLKSGSFEIPSNATIEDMVKIIAGQKR